MAVMLLLASTTVAIGINPSPAAAEIDELQLAPWGLETPGSSRVLNGWTNQPLGWAVEQSGGAMFVGGLFLDLTNGQETIRQPYMAALDAGTGEPLRWIDPDVGGPVLGFENTPDGGLMVGGEMDTYNGVQMGALVKIDPITGELWPGWPTRLSGGTSVVRDVRLEADGWLYAVGSFTRANDGTGARDVDGAVRMNPTTGAIDWNWLPDVNGGSVWGVSVSQTNNRVYLAGWFTSVNGASNTDGFAGLSTSDASVLDNRSTIPYNTCQGCTQNYRLYDVLTTEYGEVWTVGEQHAIFILEEDNNLNMRLMHYTGCIRALQNNDCTRRGGEYQELDRVGDRIYAGCHCWGWHSTDTDVIFASTSPTGTPTGSISSIGAYNPQSGQRIQSMNPYMAGTAGAFAIAGATDGCLWLAGGYDKVGPIGNQRDARDLVRLCDENGPGPDPQPNPVDPGAPSDVPPPDSCTAENDGTAATISWPAVAGANDYRIFRSVDGSNAFWRGVTTGTTFNDTLRPSGIHEYTVQARGVTGVWSSSTTCSPTLDPDAGGPDPVLPPANCAASMNGLDATITWDASVDATNYRVFRSVNGNGPFWRGATTDTSFNDTLRADQSHVYTVQARGVDGVWSTSTTCDPTLVPGGGGPDPVLPPDNCQVTNVALAGTISWDASADATDYRVYRSVDGNGPFWRGLTSDTTFNDTLRAGLSHEYTVQARGADGVWSSSASCTPIVVP